MFNNLLPLNFAALSSAVSSTISDVNEVSTTLNSLLQSSDLSEATKASLASLQTQLATLTVTLSALQSGLSRYLYRKKRSSDSGDDKSQN